MKLPISFSLFAIAASCGNQIAVADCGCDFDPTEPPKTAVIVVDAANGSVPSGKGGKFPSETNLRFVINNRNPFAYDYRLDVDTTLIELDAISAALGGLQVPQKLSDLKSAAKTGSEKQDAVEKAATPAPDAAAADVGECSASDATEIGDLVSESKQAFTATAELAEEMEQAARLYEQFETSTPALRVCQEICVAATRVSPSLETLTDLEPLNQSVRASRKAVDRLRGHIAKMPNQECAKWFAEAFEDEVADVEGALSTIDSKQKELVAAQGSLSVTRAAVSEAVGGGLVRFQDVRWPGEPATHEVKLVRTGLAKGSKPEEFPLGAYTVGESRFSFSAGVGFSFKDQKEFKKVSGLSEDDMGTMMPTNFVGVENERDVRTGVVGQLNTRIGKWWGPSWFWVLGASVNVGGGNDDDFGFYTGPGVSIADDKAFLSLAYHLIDVEKLEGGLSEGEELPPEFTGELPTKTKTEGALLLSITYRIR